MLDKDGVSNRDHLLKAEEQTGRELFTEPLPPEGAGEILWEWFFELNAGRGAGGFGPAPLTWADFQAWAELTGTPLRPWHTRVLRAMDAAYLDAKTEKAK